MIISNENSSPILIDNIETPIKTKFFWVLQLELQNEIDFTLQPLEMFEEQTTRTLEFTVNDYPIEAPTNWNILVYSEETAQVDIVEVSDLARTRHTAVLFKHERGIVTPGPIKVFDYHAEAQVKFPVLNKHTMLCHHAGPDAWICMSPTDNYNKYLKNILIGDLI